jgi:urease accessory protein
MGDHAGRPYAKQQTRWDENQMREVHELQLGIAATIKSDDVVALIYEQRQKSRLKVITNAGVTLGLFLPRGTILKHGDILLADDGSCIRVEAAPEQLSVIESHDNFQLLRAAYHLGNRHVMLQIAAGQLAYQHDHVLDDMVRGLGLVVDCVTAPFHPEAGAYHSHAANGSHAGSGSHSSSGHAHDHGHQHGHDHQHTQDAGHRHGHGHKHL